MDTTRTDAMDTTRTSLLAVYILTPLSVPLLSRLASPGAPPINLRAPAFLAQDFRRSHIKKGKPAHATFASPSEPIRTGFMLLYTGQIYSQHCDYRIMLVLRANYSKGPCSNCPIKFRR
jgi:hypothetical protein